MLRIIKTISLLILISLNLLSDNASADTDTYFDLKGYYDYSGTIGENEIKLSVYYDRNKFKGTYIYEKYRTEIIIDGAITDYNTIVLNEYDDNYKVKATFIGKLNKDDSLTGIWGKTNTDKKLKFKLKLLNAVFCEYGHRYACAGFDSDKGVIEFVERFQDLIKNDDALNISELIYYPISVKIDGKKAEIKSKKQFVLNYKKIFSYEFKKSLLKDYASYLFCNWRGIVLNPGTNEVWIGNVKRGKTSGILITAIHN